MSVAAIVFAAYFVLFSHVLQDLFEDEHVVE
jgi:hypothetical protein